MPKHVVEELALDERKVDGPETEVLELDPIRVDVCRVAIAQPVPVRRAHVLVAHAE
jgi:hypothetical protein